MLQAGRVHALGVMGRQRMSSAPNVPTFAEAGFNVTYGSWRGIAAPKGVPADVKAILIDAFTKAIQNPETKKKMEAAGYPIVFKDAAKFKKFAQEDFAYVKDILAKIK